MHTPDMPHISVFRFLQIQGGGGLRILCAGCPVYTGYARYENSNLVSRNYSIRTYCTSSNSNLVNRTHCPKDAEELKTAKYVCLTDKGYILQPLAFEIQGGVGPSTSTFLKNLCKKLCVCNQENRAGSFFRQRLSLAIQVGNAASLVGTVRDEDHLSELSYL